MSDIQREDLDRETIRFFHDQDAYHNSHYAGGILDLLREHHPVYRSSAGVLFVTGYAAVSKLLREPQTWSSQAAGRETAAMTFEEGYPTDLFLTRVGQSDGESHARMRRLLAPAFSAKGIQAWKEEIEKITEDLLDRMAEKRDVEIMAQLAFALPQKLTCAMLGLPENDLQLFAAWTHALTSRRVVEKDDKAAKTEISRALIEFADYLKSVIETRRLSPQDDVISQLVMARDDEDKLSEYELISLCQELIMGGVDTTANTIGSGVWLLLNNREQVRLLQQDLSLVGSATNEILRCEPPTFYTHPRCAVRDTELEGVFITAGERALPLVAAANRDPVYFNNPNRFDVTRSPNPHLTFSIGTHFCLGQAIARVEAMTVFGRLFQRFPKLELVSETIRWKAHPRMHGPAELYVRCQ